MKLPHFTPVGLLILLGSFGMIVYAFKLMSQPSPFNWLGFVLFLESIFLFCYMFKIAYENAD